MEGEEIERRMAGGYGLTLSLNLGGEGGCIDVKAMEEGVRGALVFDDGVGTEEGGNGSGLIGLAGGVADDEGGAGGGEKDTAAPGEFDVMFPGDPTTLVGGPMGDVVDNESSVVSGETD